MKEDDDGRQSSGSLRTGRWALALTPYPILPSSLIIHVVSVDVKHHERKDERQKTVLQQLIRHGQKLDKSTTGKSRWHRASVYSLSKAKFSRIERVTVTCFFLLFFFRNRPEISPESNFLQNLQSPSNETIN